MFDVNDTVSDLSPLRAVFGELGAPAELVQTWFAATLRDGFALTVADAKPSFVDVARGVLTQLFASDDDVTRVMSALRDLPVHEDVASGVAALKQAGLPLAALTNGSADMADQLLRRAGVRDDFTTVLSVDDAPAWKPAKSAYQHAAEVCEVAASDMMLLSAHPWDVDGAARAGLSTAWLNRDQSRFPSHFHAPTCTISAIGELTDLLAG